MNNNLAILKEFTKNKLLFEDITPLFLDRFRYYLEHTKKNKINSIYQKINFIRKFQRTISNIVYYFTLS